MHPVDAKVVINSVTHRTGATGVEITGCVEFGVGEKPSEGLGVSVEKGVKSGD